MRDQDRHNYKPSSRRSGSGRGEHNELIMLMRNNGSSGSNCSNNNNNNKGGAWLRGLMRETFFGECGTHEGLRKNEKNVFCLICCLPICPHCLPHHPSHPLLQVRRYVYQDVVRLDELEKLIDCSYIQPYTINSAKVIFLNQRPQNKPCSKGSANLCFTCDRILQQSFHFCSLSCKVNYMVDQGEDLSVIDVSNYTFSQLEGLRMDNSDIIDEDEGQTSSSNSILMDESILQYTKSSPADETMGSSVISHDQDMVLMRNKNKSNGFLPRVVLSLNNRRKGAPQRAPLS